MNDNLTNSKQVYFKKISNNEVVYLITQKFLTNHNTNLKEALSSNMLFAVVNQHLDNDKSFCLSSSNEFFLDLRIAPNNNRKEFLMYLTFVSIEERDSQSALHTREQRFENFLEAINKTNIKMLDITKTFSKIWNLVTFYGTFDYLNNLRKEKGDDAMMNFLSNLLIGDALQDENPFVKTNPNNNNSHSPSIFEDCEKKDDGDDFYKNEKLGDLNNKTSLQENMNDDVDNEEVVDFWNGPNNEYIQNPTLSKMLHNLSKKEKMYKIFNKNYANDTIEDNLSFSFNNLDDVCTNCLNVNKNYKSNLYKKDNNLILDIMFKGKYSELYLLIGILKEYGKQIPYSYRENRDYILKNDAIKTLKNLRNL